MREKGAVAPLLLGVPFGLLLGVGLYTFGYARGHSYLTDDPAACVNCHVMRGQFEGWLRSSHRRAAVCNDCHTPPGTVAKYFVKALNGLNHSYAFTTGGFPDNIRITGRNEKVAAESCVKCHAEMAAGIGETRHAGAPVNCVSCHANVGHAH
jgi:cytochrome c nitrite reductase small subunit